MRKTPIITRLTILALLLMISGIAGRFISNPGAVPSAEAAQTQGSLRALDGNGQDLGLCPLLHTDVRGEIIGILSRVTVTQKFQNSFPNPLEAVYTFPLPHDSAVDDMTIRAGGRTIRGVIKRREEARAIYEEALAQGKLAGLLDQERPNIFSQKVANILPGQNVEVTIQYVETLKYQDGGYTFVFPMVVGQRYVPGAATGNEGGDSSPGTDQVPDAPRITPPIAPKRTRAGHDISIEVSIDSAVPFTNLRSAQHEITAARHDSHGATVCLVDRAVIPNKDFILSYDVAGESLQDGLAMHRTAGDGYFMLILQPPRRVKAEEVVPKEMVFVLDTSGSMDGFPIEKAKETMMLALEGLYAGDTFNVITFSGDTHILFPAPVPANPANLKRALAFLASRSGSGGTEMMQAIRAALAPSDSQDHVRIVCFMTDGFVGDDLQIISEVQKHPNARVFAFGIGSSVNRFLLDRMAEEGRGAVEYVTLQDDAASAAKRFHERVRNPLLTDIMIEWNGLAVTDIYPRRIPDVFSAAPVVVCGRYTAGGSGFVRLRGRAGAREVARELELILPDREVRHEVLAKLWARSRIDALMGEDYSGIQDGQPPEDVRSAIIELGLKHRLMTQFTSFIAVEERVLTEGGKASRVEVPVEMPGGVSHEGILGAQEPAPRAVGVVGGVPGGVVGGVLGLACPSMMPLPTPARPAGWRAPIRVSGQIQQSKLLGRVEPMYPELARQARISAQVILQVKVDEHGNVTEARVLRGHKLLNDATVQAVRQWKYSPTLLNGAPVSIFTTAVLTFQSNRTAKLDPAVALAISRYKTGGPPDPAEKEFVRDVWAELELTVEGSEDELAAELARRGFEIVSWDKPRGTIIGRIQVPKLESLVALKSVQFIAPHRRKS